MLFQDNKDYFLSVVCGSVGIFTRDIKFTQLDIDKYIETGQSFVDELSKKIRTNPSEYEDRLIENFKGDTDASLATKEWRANLERKL